MWPLQIMNHHIAFKKTEPDLNILTWTEFKNTSGQGEKADAQYLWYDIRLKIKAP